MSNVVRKEKAYPKQPQVRMNPYSDESKSKRFHRDIGLGFRTPDTAITGDYIDKKCPFTGSISVRGRVFKGTVHKMKQEKTIVVVKNYFFYNQKYKRYERRNSKFNVHLSPCFFGLVRMGDTVTCGEVRPLSKTKRFVVIDYKQKNVGGDKYVQFADI